MSALKTVALFFVAGFVMLCGIRAAEWLIPQPAMRIIVCYGADGRGEPVCLPIKELVAIIESEQEPTP